MDEFASRMLSVFGMVLVLIALVALGVIAIYRIKSKREKKAEAMEQEERERSEQGFARAAIISELDGVARDENAASATSLMTESR